MVSFELGKEVKKDVFRLITSVEQRKNSESPQRDSGRGTRRSEVRFLMGNQNFFDLLSVTMLTCPIFYRDQTSALSSRITLSMFAIKTYLIAALTSARLLLRFVK